MGGFIGATVAPVLPVAVAMVPKRFGMSDYVVLSLDLEAPFQGEVRHLTIIDELHAHRSSPLVPTL